MLSTIKNKFLLALLGTLIPCILLCLFLLNSLHTSKENVGTLTSVTSPAPRWPAMSTVS